MGKKKQNIQGNQQTVLKKNRASIWAFSDLQDFTSDFVHIPTPIIRCNAISYDFFFLWDSGQKNSKE